MQVTLLGPVAAEDDGRGLPLGGPKQRAVFALLALCAGRVVSLDRLVDELWRDEPPSRSTLTLQSYVSRLRRVIAPQLTGGDEPRIVTRAPGWFLDIGPDHVDANRYEALVDQARGLVKSGSDEEMQRAATILVEALGLWTGEALADLTSFAFAREEAARLGELKLSTEEMLLDVRLALGEAADVVEGARRFVVANPFREHGWSILMLALYRAGRQSDALAAAAELRATLSEELGLEPSTEVRDLEVRIVRQDDVLDPPRLRPVWRGNSRTAQRHDVPLGEEARATGSVVGRGEVISDLQTLVTDAFAGHGRLVVLEAPAGAGKSTMLEVFADEFRARDGAVVAGGGAGGVGATPALWAWVTIVRQLAGLSSSRDGIEVEGPGELAERALALMHHGGDAPSPVLGPDKLGRTSLFRGVIDLLAHVRAHRPLLVMIDDAHWVDEDTLALLSLAVDELVDAGVVFAVAYRSEEPSTGVRRMIEVARRGLAIRLPLRPLDTPEVAQIVHDLSGSEPDVTMATTLRHRTSGNPLFVTQLVRLMVSEGRLDSKGVEDALPREVQDVLRRRFDRLPAQTVELLTVIAAIGRPADVDLLSRVSGLDPDTVLDSCESAVVAELLVDEGGDDGGFVLSHDLVRQALDQRRSAARLVRIHAKVADALEAQGVQTPPVVVEMAHHLRMAESVAGPEVAVPYLVRAASDAVSRYALDSAEQYLVTALETIERVPDASRRAELEAPVQAQLSMVLLHSVPGREDHDDAAVSADEGALVTPTSTDETVAWLGRMIRIVVTGDYRLATTSAERVLADQPTPVTEFAAHFILGFSSLLMGELNLAEDEYTEMERLTAAGVELHVADMFSGAVAPLAELALIAHLRGNEDVADVRLATAAVRAFADGERVVLEQHHCWLEAMRGNARGARDHAVACIALAERLDFNAYVITASIIGGWADAMVGDLTGAARADAAYAAFTQTEITMLTPLYVMLLAEAHLASGDEATARELVRSSRTIMRDSGQSCLGPRLTALSESLVPSH